MSKRSKLRRKLNRQASQGLRTIEDTVPALIGQCGPIQTTRHGMVVRCDPYNVPVEMIRDFKIRGRLADTGRTKRMKWYGIETLARRGTKQRAKQELILKERDRERTYLITYTSPDGDMADVSVIAAGSQRAVAAVREMIPGVIIESVK